MSVVELKDENGALDRANRVLAGIPGGSISAAMLRYSGLDNEPGRKPDERFPRSTLSRPGTSIRMSPIKPPKRAMEIV